MLIRLVIININIEISAAATDLIFIAFVYAYYQLIIIAEFVSGEILFIYATAALTSFTKI